MSDMTEHPLVTFALFAYNQEEYIREAVEGAFSQTYEPLEIILSDDCSSDRTFEIMQEMVATYEGPHKIRERQSPKNRGTLGHLLDVANECCGKYFVVAAGDDISVPARVELIVANFTSDTVAAISSDDIVIDKDGKERDWHAGRFQNRSIAHQKNPTWVLGATAAYRTDLLKSLPMPNERILHEDTVLQEVLGIYGKISVRLTDRLIKRRSHEDNVWFKVEMVSAHDPLEEKKRENWRRNASVMSYCAEVAINANVENRKRIAHQLTRRSRYFSYLASWPELSVEGRLKLLVLSLVLADVRTGFPRLFGSRVFGLLKKAKGLIWLDP